MMTKLTTITALAALLSHASPAVHAEAQPDAPSQGREQIAEALSALGLDQTTIDQVADAAAKAIEDSIKVGDGDDKVIAEGVQVQASVIQIGPGGEVRISGFGEAAPDSAEITPNPGEKAQDKVIHSSIDIRAIMIGPDGEKKEIEIGDLGQLDEVIKGALLGSDIDPENLAMWMVGPGLVLGSNKDAQPAADHASLENKLEELQQEMREIRAMLQSIQDKLE
jgi:hypothetical protein